MLARLFFNMAPKQIIQVRGMATLKGIAIRLKTITNIRKITRSMRMVSAAKYSRAEKDLKAARPYGLGSQKFYQSAKITVPEDRPTLLYIAVTSDKGLCGAVHMQINRHIKKQVTKDPQIKIICVGDKSRSYFKRFHPENIHSAANNVGKKTPTFLDASQIAHQVFNSGIDYEYAKIVFNVFRSVISYKTTELPLFTSKFVRSREKVMFYEYEDEDMSSYIEFSVVSLLYYTMKESSASEQSSRMTSMDSASKNAGKMIDKLRLTFNRTRQAAITRELIEIISGASALKS